VLIDRYAPGERAGYPTLCQGRFEVAGATYDAIEEPASMNTLEFLPEFIRIGMRAVKIEGRQRSPGYVSQVTRVWRTAIDAARRGNVAPRAEWMAALGRHARGRALSVAERGSNTVSGDLQPYWRCGVAQGGGHRDFAREPADAGHTRDSWSPEGGL